MNRTVAIIKAMIDHTQSVIEYCAGMSFDAFMANRMFRDGCAANIAQIGERANQLNPEFCKQYPDIPWKELRAVRNRVFHDYKGTNFESVWEIITHDLPPLREQLAALLEEITTTKG